ERWNDRGLPRVGVAGRLYVVLGKLGEGDGSDVFLARRDALLTEMVVLKVARALADQDLLDREWSALEALSRSEAKGSDYFSVLVQPRHHGVGLGGWSTAARTDAREPVAALSARARPFYTDALWAGAPPSRAGDIAMSARSMIHVMGGDPVRGTLPLAVPEPI